jgi:hypothetical protein
MMQKLFFSVAHSSLPSLVVFCSHLMDDIWKWQLSNESIFMKNTQSFALVGEMEALGMGMGREMCHYSHADERAT